MLNVLTHADVVNVTAVVTRYFGGIKLGTGGLTRAYSGCVAEAIESMPVVKRVEHDLWAVRIPHAQAGRIQEEIMRAGATVVSVVYHEEGVDLRLTTTDDPFSMIARITMGDVPPVRDGKILVEVPMRDSEV
jgi:putative IMPACT (imprinted ancient) family translation regulator